MTKIKASKFKVGEVVICIDIDSRDTFPLWGGAGWEKGYIFRINKIGHSTDPRSTLYWPKNSSGVYEPFLKRICKWWKNE